MYVPNRVSPKFRSWIIGFLATSACAAHQSRAAVSGGDDLAIAAIEARIDQLRNITAEYDVRVDHDFDPGLKAPTDADKGLEDKFTESSNCRFSFLNGGARFESYATSKTTDYWKSRGLPLIREQIQTRSATARCEELSEQLEAPAPPSYVGSIAEESQFPEDWSVDLALGLRIYREQRWLDRQDIEGAVRVRSEDSNIVVLQVPGKDAVGFVHELRFDKRLMYALVYYRGTFKADGSYVEIVNSDFRTIGKVALPFSIQRSTHYTDTNHRLRVPFLYSVAIRNYIPDDRQNVPGRFFISWPANISVYDARVGAAIDVGGVSRALSDDAIRRELNERSSSKPVARDQSQD